MEPLHDDIERRLTELEIKASFSEDTVELLNQVIIRQQQQIDSLTQDVVHLRAQLPAGDGGGGARNLRDELPPHY
jgi:SlyX protein